MPRLSARSSPGLRACLAVPAAIALLITFVMLSVGSLQAQPTTLPNNAPTQSGGNGSATQANSSDRVTNAPPAQAEPVQQGSSAEDAPRAYITYKTPYEFFLTSITVALAVFMATLLCVMGWKAGITEDFLRSFLVLIVVFAALFLIVAGYSEKQTAPVFGLLGTIVGYMFGRIASEAKGPKADTASDHGGTIAGGISYPAATLPKATEEKRAGGYPL